MSSDLQQRAREFLQRPLPTDLAYVPGSIAEDFIARYARRGALPADAEVHQLIELASMESLVRAKHMPRADDAGYFQESAAILQAILEGDVANPR